MLTIIKLPFLLIWKIFKGILFVIGRILWAIKAILSRIFGVATGILIGILGGFGKVGWKHKEKNKER